MPAQPDLVCVGRLVREMIHFPGEVKGPFLGSPPAYCSVAASRQGTATGLVTTIGQDMPHTLLAPFVAAGVDTSGIILGERTTATELIYDAQGNKEIRYPSVSDPIEAKHIPPGYIGSRLFYLCTMDNDILPEAIRGVVAQAQLKAVDLGGYGGVHMSLANRRAINSLPDLACGVSAHFDIVKASDEDTAAIFGWYDPEKAARALLATGPQVVVITLGAKGALVCVRHGQWYVPPVSGQVVDTTGGGDAFMAGFLSEYLRSADPVRAARWGCATAIWVIEGSGGVRAERMPTRAQVQARFEQTYR